MFRVAQFVVDYEHVIKLFIYVTFTTRNCLIPYGLVVRIRRSHRRGPGSIPGVGTTNFFFNFSSPDFFFFIFWLSFYTISFQGISFDIFKALFFIVNKKSVLRSLVLQARVQWSNSLS